MAEVAAFSLFVPEIRDLLAHKRYDELKRVLRELNPIDLADGWSNFQPQEQIIIFKLLDQSRTIEVFEELEFDEQFFLLNSLETGSLGPILEELPPKKAAYLFHALPDKIVRKLFTIIKKDARGSLREALAFPEGSAGRLMYPAIAQLAPAMTARQAVEVIRGATRLRHQPVVQTLFVTDEQGRLLGRIPLSILIVAPGDIRLAKIMTPAQLIKVQAAMDQEDVARLFTRYNLVDAPVVDSTNRLVGVIRADDIMDVINQEATEDMAKLAGTEADDIRAQSVFKVARIRMPWLLASWIGGILASVIISQFHELLSRIVLLAAFIPVITGMGGNVGTQSSTIVVRGLATGQIKMQRVWRLIFRAGVHGVYPAQQHHADVVPGRGRYGHLCVDLHRGDPGDLPADLLPHDVHRSRGGDRSIRDHPDRCDQRAHVSVGGVYGSGMTTIHTTPAWILRCTETGEERMQVVVYTRAFGRLSLSIRGAKRAGSRLALAQSVFREFVISCALADDAYYGRLVSAIEQSSFPCVSSCLNRFCQAAYVSEFLEAMTPERLPGPDTYALFSRVMTWIAVHEQSLLARYYCVFRLLALAGLGVQLSACAACGAPAEGGGVLTGHGYLCAGCAVHEHGGLRLTADMLRQVRDLLILEQDAIIERAADFDERALGRVADFLAACYLHRPLKSQQFACTTLA